jgi:hypothetical protein
MYTVWEKPKCYACNKMIEKASEAVVATGILIGSSYAHASCFSKEDSATRQVANLIMPSGTSSIAGKTSRKTIQAYINHANLGVLMLTVMFDLFFFFGAYGTLALGMTPDLVVGACLIIISILAIFFTATETLFIWRLYKLNKLIAKEEVVAD